ncbi:MAG: OmpA family protein [Phenylobacterium sp.]
MTTARTAAVCALTLAVCACATVRSARDRIVRPAPRCTDQTADIYFEPQSAELTKEGRAVIAAAADGAKACRVASVEVVGLSDAAGAPGANLELSKKRADSVADALKAAGLPAAEFRVGAAGQAGAVTADGKAQPMRRRAEIVLHLAAR